MRLGIDLDGVVFDFVGALRHAFSGSLEPTDTFPDPDKWEMWESWGMEKGHWIEATNAAIERGLFREGWFYPGARAGLAALKAAGHSIHLITARNRDRAGSDTAEWLTRHGVAYDSLIFNGDKTCYPVDVFIEDNVENAVKLQASGITTFLIHRTWNAGDMETCGVPYVYTWEDFVSEVESLSSPQPGKPTMCLLDHRHQADCAPVAKAIRKFESGATRDSEEGKLDFEGFLSPLVLQAFAEYMHKNRQMADGSMRASDDWQRGMPLDVYMKSKWRHFMDTWTEHRAGDKGSREKLIESLCAEIFNTQGYLLELLKDQ